MHEIERAGISLEVGGVFVSFFCLCVMRVYDRGKLRQKPTGMVDIILLTYTMR